jgi:hypothetical protein
VTQHLPLSPACRDSKTSKPWTSYLKRVSGAMASRTECVQLWLQILHLVLPAYKSWHEQKKNSVHLWAMVLEIRRPYCASEISGSCYRDIKPIVTIHYSTVYRKVVKKVNGLDQHRRRSLMTHVAGEACVSPQGW